MHRLTKMQWMSWEGKSQDLTTRRSKLGIILILLTFDDQASIFILLLRLGEIVTSLYKISHTTYSDMPRGVIKASSFNCTFNLPCKTFFMGFLSCMVCVQWSCQAHVSNIFEKLSELWSASAIFVSFKSCTGVVREIRNNLIQELQKVSHKRKNGICKSKGCAPTCVVFSLVSLSSL